MIVTGSRGTHVQFAQQLQKDFTGTPNFLTWGIGIAAVGALGYIEALRTLSRLFLALILISLVLSNRGFFAQLQAALKSGPIAPDAPPSQANSPNPAATTNNAPVSTQSGAFGQTPTNAGQAKFNGWMNYFFGGGWLK